MALKPDTNPNAAEPIPADAVPRARETAPQAVLTAPLEQPTPAAGGSYTRNPSTGELTLVTPSTIQE